VTRELQPYEAEIVRVKEQFIPTAGDGLAYDREALFAMQMLAKNDFSLKIANGNRNSVRLAMLNVASTGLTLNPAHAYAYLVPRDGSIVLDISFKGLIKIATDCGAILWARADVVYAQDEFTYNGPAAAPGHKADVFKKDRGELVGAYCIAKTREGDILCEVMPLVDIEKIRGASDYYKKKQAGPWVEFFVQMVKKSVIKRAAKTWPYTGRSGKLFEAIELAGESEGGYTFDHETPNDAMGGKPTSGAWEQIPAEDYESVRKTAATLREYFDADDLLGAVAYIERLGMPAEHQIAMWTCLPSNLRSAYKVARQTADKLAREAA
jgi:recombination protein RecT